MSWSPHLGPQTEFLARNEYEVLGGGSVGGGKSDCLIAALLRDVENPRYHGLIIRRTFPQLGEIIDRCHSLYPLIGGQYLSGPKRWTFPSGAIIDLGHMQHEDSKYNYLGREFHRIGIDELCQFSETQYLYLFSRLRTTDPDISPQILSTTNPGGVGHLFVRERFIDIARPLQTYIDPKSGLSRVFVPMKLDDNPSLLENDPEYLARLEALPEIEKMRLKYGIWDVFEGQVFRELSRSVHGCEPFEIPPEWERYCVLDWGYGGPFSVGWYAMDYDGVMYRYREWYGSLKEMKGSEERFSANTGVRMQAWEVAKGILERENGEKINRRIADTSIWHNSPEFRKQEARGITIEEDFAGEGVYFTKADRHRVHGKLQVHKRLKLDAEIDPETGEIISETPQFQAFLNQPAFWRTMQNLAEDPKNPEDVNTKMEDHVFDEFRYMCQERPIIPKVRTRANPNSFQAVRARHIRATKYAKGHGVSVATAYSRTR